MRVVESNRLAGSPSSSILIALRKSSTVGGLCPAFLKSYASLVIYLEAGMSPVKRPALVKSGRIRSTISAAGDVHSIRSSSS
jgi:hypothetical protein